MRLQDFIELVRQDRRVEAIKYARKHFNNGGKQLLKEMQSAMGLLAYSPTTRCKRYQVRRLELSIGGCWLFYLCFHWLYICLYVCM